MRGPYPLGQVPDDVLHRIGVQIVHRLAVGHRDITGDDFGGIFADAIGGLHRAKPLGIADVLWDGCGWSVKTVKYAHPSTRKDIRLISGRNDPDYSFGIENPHDDPRKTGEAVLAIWNSRVDKAKAECDELRVIVMIRNIEERVFTLFEEEARRFAPGDFVWEFNKGGTWRARRLRLRSTVSPGNHTEANLRSYVVSPDQHARLQ